MVKSGSNSKRVNNVIANFFKQTFRRHSGEEYSELLTRGMRGDGGVNKKYPWAYIRLFALMLVLYAVFLLIVRFTSNELFIPTITVLASCCFNLSFLLFLYELYPKKDLSFMSVCLALLMGGAMANVISQILFNIFSSDNPWLRAVYTGFFEELPKAAAVIAVIVTSRKNSPLAGFLMGAAVGCGFSIVEDMG
ncbi:MAG: PrsW family intramembrane metalloprotease, partial [Clostridia bacterium]|nr:PrsW family intramembrane metalloprotease [Clostridia bacterium]